MKSNITKNTMFLYVRMLVLMGVTLYTSREVLNVLGVVDFGVWNLIASFILLFSFIQNSLSSTTQRFISYELGKGNSKGIKSIFYNSNMLYLVIFLIVITLCECFGHYLVSNLKIPVDRIDAAYVAYHFVILDFSFKILRLPFESIILSHEKMKFYAYISILEGGIALIAVFILKYLNFEGDRLILYAMLLACSTVVVNLVYYRFCFNEFGVLFFKFHYDKEVFKSLFSFTSWALLGGMATVLSIQGANILINLFFGVVVNAAMSIANQASTAVNKFVYNFQLAYIPKITKLYSMGDDLNLKKLIISSSKLSFLLCWILAFPLIFNIDYLFNLWLVTPPPYAKELCRLILITFLVEGASTPLWITVQAEGKIKKYQIVYSLIMLSNIALSYFFLSLGYNVYWVLYVKIFISCLSFLVRLFYAAKTKVIEFGTFFVQVVLKCFGMVFFSSALIIFFLSQLEDGIWKLILSSGLFFIMTCLISFYFFFGIEERTWVRGFIKKKIDFIRLVYAGK